jgi:hypothetical protein
MTRKKVNGIQLTVNRNHVLSFFTKLSTDHHPPSTPTPLRGIIEIPVLIAIVALILVSAAIIANNGNGISVNASPPSLPAGGGYVDITWSIDPRFTSCFPTASPANADWSLAHPDSSNGGDHGINVTQTTTVTITCFDSSGNQSQDSTTIQVPTGPPPPPIACSPKTTNTTLNQPLSFNATGPQYTNFSWSTNPAGNPPSSTGAGFFETRWDQAGTKTVTVSANGQSDSCQVTVTGQTNNKPSDPTTPNGPANVSQGSTNTYTSSASDPDGNTIRIELQAYVPGSNTYQTVASANSTGGCQSPCTVNLSYTFGQPGVYNLRTIAYDSNNLSSQNPSGTLQVQAGIPTPTNPQVTQTGSAPNCQVRLSWNSNANTGWSVNVATDPGFSANSTKNVAQGQSSVTALDGFFGGAGAAGPTQLYSGVTYYWRLYYGVNQQFLNGSSFSVNNCGSPNQKPSTPTKPSGPASVTLGNIYNYTSSATDPDGDPVRITYRAVNTRTQQQVDAATSVQQASGCPAGCAVQLTFTTGNNQSGDTINVYATAIDSKNVASANNSEPLVVSTATGPTAASTPVATVNCTDIKIDWSGLPYTVGPNSQNGFNVEISTDQSFPAGSTYSKFINNPEAFYQSTIAPDGFNKSGILLTILGSTKYYVRVFNGSNSPVGSFVFTPPTSCGGTSSLPPQNLAVEDVTCTYFKLTWTGAPGAVGGGQGFWVDAKPGSQFTSANDFYNKFVSSVGNTSGTYQAYIPAEFKDQETGKTPMPQLTPRTTYYLRVFNKAQPEGHSQILQYNFVGCGASQPPEATQPPVPPEQTNNPQEPAPFSLQTPANEAQNLSKNPTFSWEKSTNASHYFILIGKGSNTLWLKRASTNNSSWDHGNGWGRYTTNPSIAPPAELEDGVAYTWNVAAYKDANSASKYSDNGSFQFKVEQTTVTEPKPANPSNLSAESTCVEGKSQINFNWKDNANNEDGYIIDVSLSNNWSTWGYDVNVPANSTSYTWTTNPQDKLEGGPPNVPENGKSYYWRLIARNSASQSPHIYPPNQPEAPGSPVATRNCQETNTQPPPDQPPTLLAPTKIGKPLYPRIEDADCDENGKFFATFAWNAPTERPKNIQYELWWDGLSFVKDGVEQHTISLPETTTTMYIEPSNGKQEQLLEWHVRGFAEKNTSLFRLGNPEFVVGESVDSVVKVRKCGIPDTPPPVIVPTSEPTTPPVTTSGVNLVAKSFSFDKTTVNPGDEITISFKVANNGVKTAPTFKAQMLFDSKDKVECGISGPLNYSIQGFRPNPEGEILTARRQIPDKITPGPKTARLFLDSECEVNEDSEDDNQLTFDYTVAGPPESFENLQAKTDSNGYDEDGIYFAQGCAIADSNKAGKATVQLSWKNNDADFQYFATAENTRYPKTGYFRKIVSETQTVAIGGLQPNKNLTLTLTAEKDSKQLSQSVNFKTADCSHPLQKVDITIEVDGPKKIKAGENAVYKFKANVPKSKSFKIGISWGNGDEFTPELHSGEVYTTSHVWYTPGNYYVWSYVNEIDFVDIGKNANNGGRVGKESGGKIDLNVTGSNAVCTQVVNNGNPSKKLDITFLPIKYDQSEMNTFANTVKYLTSRDNGLLHYQPYSEKASSININRVDHIYLDVESMFKELIEPGPGRFAVSYQKLMNITYNAATSVCPSDKVVLIVKGKGQAQALIDQDQIKDVAIIYIDELNQYSGSTMTHEFSHTLAHLGDEYITDKSNLPPDAKNCSLTKESAPWKDYPGTGFFSGCTYDNYYRPTISSLMRNSELRADGLDVWNIKLIRDILNKYE